MRTTVNIDAELLAAAKVRAAQHHQTIGSVLEEALRRMFSEQTLPVERTVLPDFAYQGGVQPGVDLYDRAAMAMLLGEASR